MNNLNVWVGMEVRRRGWSSGTLRQCFSAKIDFPMSLSRSSLLRWKVATMRLTCESRNLTSVGVKWTRADCWGEMLECDLTKARIVERWTIEHANYEATRINLETEIVHSESHERARICHMQVCMAQRGKERRMMIVRLSLSKIYMSWLMMVIRNKFTQTFS